MHVSKKAGHFDKLCDRPLLRYQDSNLNWQNQNL